MAAHKLSPCDHADGYLTRRFAADGDIRQEAALIAVYASSGISLADLLPAVSHPCNAVTLERSEGRCIKNARHSASEAFMHQVLLQNPYMSTFVASVRKSARHSASEAFMLLQNSDMSICVASDLPMQTLRTPSWAQT